MDTKPNPIKAAPPLSMAQKIAANTKKADALPGIQPDQEAAKRLATKQSRLSHLTQIREDSNYNAARTLNHIVLCIAILGVVFGVGLALFTGVISAGVSAVVSSLAIIILTSVAKAVFDIADQVLSNK